mgnify:CR=1 FL=1
MKEKLQYKILAAELQTYLPALAEAAETIVTNDVSLYPIFVIHQHFVDIGIQMVDRDKVSGNWSVNASTLEEFATKQIITSEKVDAFRKVYKGKQNEFCLFVLSELGADFIFLPKNGDI